jgi:hypothetical protein
MTLALVLALMASIFGNVTLLHLWSSGEETLVERDEAITRLMEENRLLRRGSRP